MNICLIESFFFFLFFFKSGFCGIPPALVQRYAEELELDIYDIADTLDYIRLNCLLKKFGKQGVSTNFHSNIWRASQILGLEDKSADKTELYFASHIRENIFLQQHMVNDTLGKNRVIKQNIIKGVGSRDWDEQN